MHNLLAISPKLPQFGTVNTQKSESISVRLESDIAEKLDKLAASACKSRAQYIRLHVAAANNWQIRYEIKLTETPGSA